MTSAKETVYKIQQRKPLGDWETVATEVMTWDTAAQTCGALLIRNGGDAIEARFSELWRNVWTYVPRFTN